MPTGPFDVNNPSHPCAGVCAISAARIVAAAGLYDEPVSIMRLKRFVTDWAYEHRFELKKMVDKSLVGTPFHKKPAPSGKKIAVIGAGPAGLTAALDLVRLGHGVTVFDALAVAGGMMRVGIPPHRLPYEYLDWEVEQILDEGVELKLNTWVEDIAGLIEFRLRCCCHRHRRTQRIEIDDHWCRSP